MNSLERAILKYLESRDGTWKWIQGRKTYSRDETIRLFKGEKKFRKSFMQEAVKTTVDSFLRAAEKASPEEKPPEAGEEDR